MTSGCLRPHTHGAGLVGARMIRCRHADEVKGQRLRSKIDLDKVAEGKADFTSEKSTLRYPLHSRRYTLPPSPT